MREYGEMHPELRLQRMKCALIGASCLIGVLVTVVLLLAGNDALRNGIGEATEIVPLAKVSRQEFNFQVRPPSTKSPTGTIEDIDTETTASQTSDSSELLDHQNERNPLSDEEGEEERSDEDYDGKRIGSSQNMSEPGADSPRDDDTYEEDDDSNNRFHNETNSQSEWYRVRCSAQVISPTTQTRTRIPLSTGGTWCLDTTGTWRFRAAVNPTRRTKKGFKRCLANKHLLFIGDSRVRYQYLSLALFLAHGEFPYCHEWGSSRSGNTWCRAAHETQGWQDFYQKSNDALLTTTTSELCYCYRNPPGPLLFNVTRENRFFTSQSEFGPIKISYIQSFKDACALDTSFPPYSKHGDRISCSQPGTCSRHENASFVNEEFTINGTVNCAANVTAESRKKQSGAVTHVFASTGWGQEDIGCDLMAFAKNTGVKAWVMGSPHKNGYNAMVPDVPPKQSCGAPQFDRDAMTFGLKELYTDAVHVVTSVNAEFNHKLMDTICPV